MARRERHVVPDSKGGWSVRVTGASRAERVFTTKDAAVTYATVAARREHSEVIVHGRDGTIKSKDSYGKDPKPPKDREH